MKIDIDHFTKKIHGRIVLSDVDLHFDSGDAGLVVGLQGINGSGKTMLIRAICGLIYPTQGTAAIDGKILGKGISFPPSVGALIENPAFLNKYTGRRNLELLSSIRGTATQDRIDGTLRSVGLDPGDRRAYRKYSLGMKQRLGIAAVNGLPRFLGWEERRVKFVKVQKRAFRNAARNLDSDEYQRLLNAARVQIWREMKRICGAAGVERSKVFPHNLRRLFAVTFCRATKDIAKLADILGHSSINTTRICLLSTDAEHVRCLERLRLVS